MEILHHDECNGAYQGLGMNVNIDKKPNEIVFYGDFTLSQLAYFKEELEVALEAINGAIATNQKR